MRQPRAAPRAKGDEKKKERDDGVPSYDASGQGHTRQDKKRERERESERGAPSYEKERDDGVPSYDSSVHTPQEKEGERERGSPYETSVQGHTKGEGLYLSIASRNAPKNTKKEEGRGKGETAAATCAVPKWLAALTAAVA